MSGTWADILISLSQRVKDATHGVGAVGALLLGFQVKLGLIRGKYLPAGLHAVEASYVSASVWSSKMPLASNPVILGLLDGLVGEDPAYYIVRAGFRMMRRFGVLSG